MGSLGEIMKLCRLCLVKDQVNVPIFEGAGDIRKISQKIGACLPVKVTKDDKLPKKICNGCSHKLDMVYQFWNTTTSSEKQLLEWVNNPSSRPLEERGVVAEHIVLKQEVDNGDSEALDAGEFIDVNETFETIGFAHDDDDEMSNENIDIKTENDSRCDEPPIKKHKTVSLSSAESEEDADDPSDAYNRDDSDEDDNDVSEAQPAFVNVAEADQQPGPSGVGKASGEAPSDSALKTKKEQFNLNLEKVIARKATNTVILSREKYQELLNEILDLKRTLKRKTPADYQKLKRYDVFTDDNGDKLICPSPDNSVVKYYISTEELFDVIHETHMAIKHGGRDRMTKELKKKYKNVTTEIIMLYLDLCDTCQKRGKVHKKLLPSKPAPFLDLTSRCQINLIDMQNYEDRTYKFVLVYQDYLTKFVQLRPLKSKTPEEVALALLDIFTIFGAPVILHSDESDDITGKIIEQVCFLWPGLKILLGKSFVIKHHVKTDIGIMLRKWLDTNQTIRWADSLRFIQFTKNRSYQDVINCTPYEAMFGHPVRAGLSTSKFPEETLQGITTEEELQQVIAINDSFDFGENENSLPPESIKLEIP